ncbi:MAG: UDP-2,3-diacylglucosamine hydrolase [Sphingobacteriales bacterium 17-39-43]|uniref:UDP-2,3-diacylglucosamine diphosphatase n=1 Tax=Daejeonella sp. TaxID=2805397 RepID=UPI000BCEED0D|nr:UDP-2,3-diacylglucosamine diphosphatase [Daejeonella sp.]OYZ32479.1 MAG: UDP-2,3-diacylglucosamine hydrolase [Sphingobacteriales bacterium 16-39-50]OZA25842.1 MAG: UDP-2,3-diacylglucosamine hydrolase [Sphingobacteriales bacterium 17-39-43]HQT21961.1 UDP-2,3-diacylglucosamine diphosphatase [Daejeonella sp.]HQT57268.1 UDP-2,3-diacylglucosamine diphosphatase [Daejeonella sp.]
MKKGKRQVDIIVISDVHLGTYGCRAKELLHYLKSIKPKIVVLNGDIIDIWQFSKSYWPKSHMKVIKHLMNWLSKGVKVYYVTGNHDEMLRKFEGFKMGSFQIVNKLVLELDNSEKAWIFHGDVFDVTMQHSKWLAKLGAVGYDSLIGINSLANWISEKVFNKGKLSFSKKLKNSVKSAVKFINSFEQTAADIGISNNYQYVVCGHIHHPEMRLIEQENGKIMYLNSGDWIENLSALEYHNGNWTLFRFDDSERVAMLNLQEEESDDMSIRQLFNQMLTEFKLKTS